MSIKNGSNIFVSQEEDCIYVDGIRYVPESTNDWVSCDERLPEETGLYLTASLVGSMNAKTVVNILRGQMTEHYGFRWNEMDWQRVTHWMPLPELPKDK